MKQTMVSIGLLMLLVACSGGGSSSDATASPDGTTNSIMVYDDNGQYLGVLLGVESDNTQVFIPAMGMVTDINRYTSQVDSHWFWYDSPDCTGEAYTIRRAENIIDRNPSDGLHYVRRIYGAIIVNPDYGSLLRSDGTCFPLSAPAGGDVFEAEEVQLPFTMPVAMPLQFEYE